MRTYRETLDYLFSQLPMYQRDGKAAIKKDLNNTMALCKLLGNPEEKFRSIHIAGTNGKGSTAHMMASIFQEAGYKTGLYTSPHLKDFRERIKINGSMIKELDVIDFVESHQAIFQDIRPSFFEWTVALAFNHFAKEEVDIAIIETGLGGRLDSTNVINPELSIITNIAMDHTDMLGDTIELIANEKAGIIKESTPVVIGNTSNAKEVFAKKASEKGSAIYYAENFPMPILVNADLRGNYQRENLKTVYTAWHVLRLKTDFQLSYIHFVRGVSKSIKNTSLRGRWEILSELPKTITDVAHNEAGLSYVLEQLKEESYDQLHIVLGLVKEKDHSKILKLFPQEANFYFCAANIPRSLEAEKLQSLANTVGLKGEVYSSVEEAIKEAQAMASKQDLIYIGGSTFVVAEAL